MLIYLSGLMGSGKSTVAREVARHLGVPAVDLDELVAARAGMSIAKVFRDLGESAFRALERDEALKIAGGRRACVVALGGGTVVDRTTRWALIQSGIVVTLEASPREVARRLAGANDRPLLANKNAEHVLTELAVERASAYAECHARISTDGRSVESIASDVLAVMRSAPVVVPLGERTYRVEIGSGVRSFVAARAKSAASGELAMLVTDDTVRNLWSGEVASSLAGASKRVVEIALPTGEKHKTLASVETIWNAALEQGVDRNSLVVGAGGGVVGDVSGFAASTLLRGVALGHVPTTLLAMVDSSVGGKTGFDRPQGKNLVGTFYQPRFVLCDVDVLSTLPDRQRRAGFAEIVKSAWLDGESSVAMLENDADALSKGDPAATERAIRMAVNLKARIVTDDERESSGRRVLLNLGHTLGHAIEAAGDYEDVLHGEAVALGMVAAFRVAQSLGDPVGEPFERICRLLSRLGLPTDVRPRLTEELLPFLSSDKKRDGERVQFIVPGEPGKTRVVPLLTAEVISRAAQESGMSRPS